MVYGVWKIFFSFVFSVIATAFVYLNIRKLVPGAELLSILLFILLYAGFTRLFRL